jgi:adenosylcobinamide kinase / adenosylcobinamide-phosphate guanylyltransferase
MFTFVTGGFRSGKSEYALGRASEHGPPPWLYVAPHIDGDDELKARLARHRRDQEATWKLIESPPKLLTALEPATLAGYGAVVLDRFSVWLANRIETGGTRAEFELTDEVEELADRLYRSTTPIVLVTTEIGLGSIPGGMSDRRMVNIAGLANQILAERAQSVVLMVSGVPLRLR